MRRLWIKINLLCCRRRGGRGSGGGGGGEGSGVELGEGMMQTEAHFGEVGIGRQKVILEQGEHGAAAREAPR
jgi:hypothetical protein